MSFTRVLYEHDLDASNNAVGYLANRARGRQVTHGVDVLWTAGLGGCFVVQDDEGLAIAGWNRLHYTALKRIKQLRSELRWAELDWRIALAIDRYIFRYALAPKSNLHRLEEVQQAYREACAELMDAAFRNTPEGSDLPRR